MNMKRILLKRVISFASPMIGVILGACSVGMSLSGQKTPNVSMVKKAVARQEVEVQFGQPLSVCREGSCTVAVYKYPIGKDPSPGRAIGHGVLDVLSGGLWELFGTPIEACSLGEMRNLHVKYDGPYSTSRVISFWQTGVK